MDVRVGLWRKLSAEELMLLNCGVVKTLESPVDSRRSNQSILKEISPGCSLEGLMLKLKLQYFGHLMGRVERKKVKMKLLSRAPLFATPWIVACTKLLHPWDFQGKSTGVCCHFLLQGIFPTQESNWGLSHCRQMLYRLNHQGSWLIAKSWLIGKDSDAGRDWGQKEKGTTEDEMAGWHLWLDGREFEWTPGDGDGQGSLVCCDLWGHKESDTTERLNWTEPKSKD